MYARCLAMIGSSYRDHSPSTSIVAARSCSLDVPARLILSTACDARQGVSPTHSGDAREVDHRYSACLRQIAANAGLCVRLIAFITFKDRQTRRAYATAALKTECAKGFS